MNLLGIIAASRRRAAGSYDADAQTWFDNIVTAGSTISDTNKTAASDLFAGLKTDSIWSKIGCLYLFAGPDSLAGSVTRAKGPAGTAYNFTSSEFNRTTGLLGIIANTTYIDTAYAANSNGVSDHHIAVHTSSSAFANNRALGGANGASSGGTQLGLRAAGIRTRSTQSTIADTTVTPAAGFFCISRDNSTDYILNHNGSETPITQTAAGSIASNNWFAFAYSVGSTPNHICADRIAVWSVGAALTSGERANLRTRITTYMAALT
jgi:hypothetical protein